MSNLSGKFVVRIDPQLHKTLKAEALEKGLSLNRLVVQKLSNTSKDDFLEPVTKVFKQDLIGVVLFGSTARGEANSSSDQDLLLVLKDTCSIDRELYRMWDKKVSSLIAPSYSPQFVHLPREKDKASSLWLEVALEGEIQWDPLGEVRKTIYDLKELIAEGRAQRKISHGQPYWVWKEEENAK